MLEGPGGPADKFVLVSRMPFNIQNFSPFLLIVHKKWQPVVFLYNFIFLFRDSSGINQGTLSPRRQVHGIPFQCTVGAQFDLFSGNDTLTGFDH